MDDQLFVGSSLKWPLNLRFWHIGIGYIFCHWLDKKKKKSLGHCQSDAVLGVYWQNMVVSVCLKLRQKQSMSGSPVNDTTVTRSLSNGNSTIIWNLDVVSYSPRFPAFDYIFI